MSRDLANWVSELPKTLAKKLAAVGLIELPDAKPSTTLGEFLANYVESRTDVKQATRIVWRHVVRNLKEFLAKIVT